MLSVLLHKFKTHTTYIYKKDMVGITTWMVSAEAHLE